MPKQKKDSIPQEVPVKPVETLESFPMGLREFAATARLDPVTEAGLKQFSAKQQEFTFQEWQTVLARFRSRPVRNV